MTAPSGMEGPLLEPGSAEWLQVMSASKVAAVLGLSRWESRFSLYHRMSGIVGPVEETDEMRRGHYLEPACVAWFTDQHPDWLIHGSGTWTHPERPRQTATPDRLIHAGPDLRVLECKTDMQGYAWGEPHTDQVPIDVRIQCLWQLDTIGVDTAHVVVLDGQLTFREYVVTYDPIEVAQIRDAVDQFLNDLDHGVRPDIDDHTQTYAVIKEMHPDIDGGEVELPASVARTYIDAKVGQKQHDAAARAATSLVADRMGNAHRAVWDGRTIATRQARDGGTPYVVIARGLLADTAVVDDRPLVGVIATDPTEAAAHPDWEKF